MSSQAAKDQILKMLQENFQRDQANLGDAAQLPPNYEFGSNGQIQAKPKGWMEKWGWTLPIMIGTGGAALAAGLGGAGAGAGIASTTGLNAPLAGLPLYNGAGALAGASAGAAAPAAAAASHAATPAAGGVTGLLKKLKDSGIDLTTLGLGGLSMLGGSTGIPKPYDGVAGAQKTLEDALAGTHEALDALKSQGPIRMRSSYAPPPPAPVTIPGIPFQIGGGLGRDPALDDPSLLELANPTKLREPK